MLLNSSLNESQEQSISQVKYQKQSYNKRKKKKRVLQDFQFIVESRNGGTGKDIIGKGAFGSVKLAKEIGTENLFAIKAISKQILQEHSSTTYLKREIKLQKKLTHPHIIQLFSEFEDSENVYLLLEYAQNGCLFKHLRRKKKFQEKEAFVYFFQTCLGVDYLHKMGIIHRDLKPENLLLDLQGNIKICDFGWSAESLSGMRSTFCGTLDYMSPEMLSNKPHDNKVDIWSLGVLLFEMLHGYAPFSARNTKDKIIQAILACDVTGIQVANTVSVEAKELIVSLLKSDPLKRLSFEMIFQHPWLKRFEKEQNINIQEFITKDIKKKKIDDKASFQQLFQDHKKPQDLSVDSKSSANSNLDIPRSISPMKMTEEMINQKKLLFAYPVSPVPQIQQSIDMSYSQNINQSSVIDTSLIRGKSREKIFDVSKPREHPINKYSISPNKSQLPSFNTSKDDVMSLSASIQQKYQKGDLSISSVHDQSPMRLGTQNVQDQRDREQAAMKEALAKTKNSSPSSKWRIPELSELQKQEQENKALYLKEQQRMAEAQQIREKDQNLETLRLKEKIQRQKDAEVRQKELEAQRQLVDMKRREDEEREQRLREKENQKQQEIKHRELEQQRIRDLEQGQKEQEQQRQRDLQLEQQKNREKELEQQRNREIDQQRQREIDQQRQREIDQQRQREYDVQKQQTEMQERELLEQQRQEEYKRREMEKQREHEQKLRDMDLQHQQRQRELDAQRLKVHEQKLREQEEARIQEIKQKEYELQREMERKNEIAEMQVRKQREQESASNEQERLLKLRQEQLKRQQEQEKRKRLEQEQRVRDDEMKRKQALQQLIPPEDRVGYSINVNSINKSMTSLNQSGFQKEKELENRLDQILGINFGLIDEAPRIDQNQDESMQQKQYLDWKLSEVQDNLKQIHEEYSPMNRPTDNRVTKMEDRNTYIGDIIDDCCDYDVDLQGNSQLHALNQLNDVYGKPNRPQRKPESQNQSRSNKFSFGEPKVHFGSDARTPELELRNTKIEAQTLTIDDLKKQKKRIQSENKQGKQNVSFNSNNRSISQFIQIPEDQDDTLDRELKQYNKYDSINQSLQSSKSNKSNKKQNLNKSKESEYSKQNESKQNEKNSRFQSNQQQSFDNKLQQNQRLKQQESFDNKQIQKSFDKGKQQKQQSFDDRKQQNQRLQKHGQQRNEEEEDEQEYQRFGPRRSRISERNKEVRYREIKRKDELQELDFFDRVKFAFGCLSRNNHYQK